MDAVVVVVAVVVGRFVVKAVEGGGLCGTLTSMGDRAAVIAISSECGREGKDWLIDTDFYFFYP